MTDMQMNRSRSKKQGVEKNELDRVGVDDGRNPGMEEARLLRGQSKTWGDAGV